MLNTKKTQIHGHRGCRGYLPENTLAGFLKTLDFAIDAIELDVVISKDKQVVVSHEPFMHYKKCLHPNLTAITLKEQEKLIIYQMNYAEVASYDCGLVAHPQFPNVVLQAAYKPLLSDVFTEVENKIKYTNRKPVIYSIEIKSEESQIGISQPDYLEFCKLVIDEIERFNLTNRVMLQSFDKKVLQQFQKMITTIPLLLLVEDNNTIEQHLEELGFIPTAFSMDYTLITTKKIKQLNDLGIDIFAFTVNDESTIKSLSKMGVSAIVSDYPDLAIEAVNS